MTTWTLLAAAVEPDAGLTGLLPYLTGAGGCIVALALGNLLFLTGRILSSTTVQTLRRSDSERLDEMREQRDTALASLEKANANAAIAAEIGRESMALLRAAGRDDGSGRA